MIIRYPALTILAFFIAIVLAINATIAAEPELTTSVSTDAVRVAETFTLDITVHADQGTKVVFPEGQVKLGPFDVRDIKDMFDIPVEGDANSRTWTRTFTLDTIETGDLQVPPINIQVQSPPDRSRNDLQSVAQQLTTNSVLVRVASVLEDRSDPTKFRDIESVVDVAIPEASTSSVPWAAGGAALTAIALFVGTVVRRRRQWTTPLKWAVVQLDSLDPYAQEVTHQLSQIVREFLVQQFEVSETGNTPQEILNQLQEQKKLAATAGERLKCLFEIADKTKFAGLCLSPEGLASAIKDSRSMVKQIADDTITAGS